MNKINVVSDLTDFILLMVTQISKQEMQYYEWYYRRRSKCYGNTKKGHWERIRKVSSKAVMSTRWVGPTEQGWYDRSSRKQDCICVVQRHETIVYLRIERNSVSAGMYIRGWERGGVEQWCYGSKQVSDNAEFVGTGSEIEELFQAYIGT